jgi:hypothetical protein
VISLTFLIRYAFDRRPLLKDHIDDEMAAEARRYRPSYLAYLVAIAVGLLFPVLAVALYLGIALYLGVPGPHDPPAGESRVARQRRVAPSSVTTIAPCAS